MNKDDLARVLAKKNYISVAKAKILVSCHTCNVG